MDGLVTIRSHRPIKPYLRRKQFHGMKYLKTHPVWESQRNPEERKKYAEILHVILQKAKPYTRTRKGKFERVKGYPGRSKKPEFEYGDFIVLKPDADVSLSYKEGNPPQKYLNDRGLWAVDGYEEEEGILNINRVLDPYPGAYCGFVHKDDVVKVSSAKERQKKESKRSAPLADIGVKPGDWKVINGEWRIAKVGFLRTGSGEDDYETAVRWYLPKTGSELRESRRKSKQN